MKEFLIPEMNILTVHRHWEGVCSGPDYSKHFQSAVEPHTFCQFAYFLANLQSAAYFFADIGQSGIPDTLSPDSLIFREIPDDRFPSNCLSIFFLVYYAVNSLSDFSS